MRLENLDDGSKLEAAWTDALTSSLTYFRALLSSSASSSWKAVSVAPLTASTTARDGGNSQAHGSSLGRITADDVNVHRRASKSGEVYRAIVEVNCGKDVSVDTFRGCLVTPETRSRWDRMVEEATTLDFLDAHTRVTRTNYRLGWPSSPRDVVTISKTLVDQYTLIDISTSLPRSRHEPAYLRPAPPYVRAHINLLAWCIQLPNPTDTSPPDGKARITCFWSWNPKGSWAVGGGVPQHLPSLMVGLVDYVRDGSERVPLVLSYGPDVSVGATSYDVTRVTLSVTYAIVNTGLSGDNEGLRRQIEFGLSSSQSWDVQIQVRAQNGEESSSTQWTSFVGQAPSTATFAPKRLVLRFAHAQLQHSEELVRVNVSIERTASAQPGVRINGIPVAIESMGPTPLKRPLLDETASASGISLRTLSTLNTMETQDFSDIERKPGRGEAAEKSIASMIRRNYIYFTSLLQEPEGKWRPVLDSRGVAIHQLDSIDKTLVVFRAEAVFVGVSIWDLYATIASPGARVNWDKSHEDAALLEDVNELTDLWHFRSKAAWPTSARDSVMLRTTYKSPASVHLFGFSIDNTELFPRIPPSIDPTVIRTQIDLQGWSIESLSPNTTQVTLLEQSDPRGWSNKSSIPQVMMSTLAGIGEFAIKHGAPPTVTRLGGGRSLSSRYDSEKETFRFEYEQAEARRSHSSGTSTAFPLPVAVKSGETSESSSLKPGPEPHLNLECEIRCDADQWASSFAVLIDPPPKTISVLKRHRLSHEGGGLWLTIEHDPNVLGKEKVIITVRRGIPSASGKTLVTINGSKTKVDVEDLHEADVKLLQKQKRLRPTRAPLDQPPALGTLRKKQSTMSLAEASTQFKTVSPSTYTRLTMPLTRWYSLAAESTKAAIVPVSAPSLALPPGTSPVDAAVKALRQLTRMHSDRDGESTDPNGWQPVSDRDALKVEKRLVSHVSETFPVFRAGRIIEGFTAEEVSASISISRKDERFDIPTRLQSFGPNITTSHVTAYTTFPFRGRSMLLSTIVARLPDGPPPSPGVSSHASLSTILHASTSLFDPSTLDFDSTKYNPTTLPTGKVILEGWILETVDPYSHEQYAIPSTRCMYISAVDYSGNVPLSVNNMLNASLPRVLLTVESELKAKGPPSRARAPAMMTIAPEPNTSGPWAIESLDDRTGIDVYNDGHFHMTVTVKPTIVRDDNLSPALRHTDSRVSVTSGRSTVINLAEDIRRGRRDLMVAEVDIGASLANSGCEIEVAGQSLPASQFSLRSEPVLPLKLAFGESDLPFKVTVISLAPSLLQSASLDPSQASRHLLRVTLPTSAYEPSVDDPLSSRTPPLPRPRWLLDLLNDGAVVTITLKPSETPGYRFKGQDIIVEDERGRNVKEGRLPRLITATEHMRPLAVANDVLSRIPEPVKAESVVGSVADSPPAVPIALPPEPVTDKRYSFWKYPRLTRFSISAPNSASGSPTKTAAPLTLAPEDDRDEPKPEVEPAAVRTDIMKPVVSIPTLVIACLVCLLFGSLLRSILAEAEFVIYPQDGQLAAGEWRELKRIMQWSVGWDRDLVIAIARRR